MTKASADFAKPKVLIHELEKAFGSFRALRGVSLSIQTAEVVALIGPSGSGKSTLMRCINQLEAPERGYVSIEGDPMGYEYRNGKLFQLSNARLSQQRSRVGMVFQHFNLFRHLTALENVMFGPVNVLKQNRNSAERTAIELLKRYGLGDKLHSYPSQLSGGQQQRTAIARALAMDPMLLLLDEPTSALDPELCGEVVAAIRSLAAEGRTMVLSSHDMDLVKSIADRVYVLADGEIIETGDTHAVLDHPQHPRTVDFLNRVALH